MPVIDSHQHFWHLGLFDTRWLERLEHRPICRDFLPGDLAPLLQAAGVERSVFVQTQHNVEENRWILTLAEQHPFIAGVVGWIDLASPDCERQLEEFAAHPKFVGVRHVVQDEPDDDFIIRPEFLRGLAVLERLDVPYDLLFYVRHLRHAATLAARLPDLRLVINHLAKPQIKAGEIDAWRSDLAAAARHPNVWCKLSGMVTEADWQAWRPADLKPYVQAALELFGPQRLMYGSDWPVSVLAGTYQQVFDALGEALGPISADERAQIFGGTAAEFYRLGV